MTYPNGKRPTIWGSNASGPVGWIVGIVSVLMLIVALYLYAVREKTGAPDKSPNATSGASNPSPVRPAVPGK